MSHSCPDKESRNPDKDTQYYRNVMMGLLIIILCAIIIYYIMTEGESGELSESYSPMSSLGKTVSPSSVLSKASKYSSLNF